MDASQSAWVAVLYWTYIACLAYYIGINAYYAILFIFSILENRFRVFQQQHEDFRNISRSLMTLPVSVIVPAYNEAPGIVNCVRSILKMDYPQTEVIVINDGSTDDTLQVLIDEFDLSVRDLYYRRTIETLTEARQIYRSRTHANLIVVDKPNSGKSDTLNLGLNISRYPYVLTCDADTVFERQALLKAMRMVLRDPDRVVGVGSLTGIGNGLVVRDGEIIERHVPDGIFACFQSIEYTRAFLVNRLAWSKGGFMLVVIGAFALWRRDLTMELGGFSTDFTCEDIEFTFRVHEHMRRNKKPYKILSLPDPVCWTEGPHTIKNLYMQRHRWQRVISETFFAYVRMLFNPRYGSVGWVGMPYYLFGEVLAPFFEVAAAIVIPFAWVLGVFSLKTFLIFVGIIVLTNVCLSVAGVLLHDIGFRTYSARDLRKLIFVSFFEWFGYRQLLSLARLFGFIGFLLGNRRWNKFDRVGFSDEEEEEAASTT